MSTELTTIKDDRLRRYESGESVEEIAETDGVTPQTVELSIKATAQQIEFMKVRELRILKIEAQKANEEIRIKLREELTDKAQKTVEQLMKNKDPKAKAEGVKLFMKLASLEEKPMAPQTTVNVQQQQNNSNGSSEIDGYPDKMEERIARIRKDQLEGHRKAGLIDVEPIASEEEPEKNSPTFPNTRREDR